MMLVRDLNRSLVNVSTSRIKVLAIVFVNSYVNGNFK